MKPGFSIIVTLLNSFFGRGLNTNTYKPLCRWIISWSTFWCSFSENLKLNCLHKAGKCKRMASEGHLKTFTPGIYLHHEVFVFTCSILQMGNNRSVCLLIRFIYRNTIIWSLITISKIASIASDFIVLTFTPSFGDQKLPLQTILVKQAPG